MSKRKIGNKFQTWIEKYLRKLSYDVVNFKTVSKMIPSATGKMIWISQRQDFFGCDLAAIKPNEKILFIQASLSQNIGKRLKEFQKYGFPLKNCKVQLWLKRPDNSIAIKEYNGEALVDIGKIIRSKFYSLREN